MSAAAEAPPRPRPAPDIDTGIPALAELTTSPQWVGWVGVPKPNGKVDKVPHRVGGRKADTTKRYTWTTYPRVAAEVQKGVFDGPGFVFSDQDEFCGVDLDRCRDPETGEIAAWAWEEIRRLDTYTEVSPSGKGVKLFARGRVPEGRKVGDIEVYSEKRFFTVTGRHLAGTPTTINPAHAAIKALWERLTAQQGRRTCDTAGNGAAEAVDWDEFADAEQIRAKLDALIANDERFRRSWEHRQSGWADQSLSSYDQSLCNIAARSGWGDTELALLIRVHRERHGSDKWRRADYVERTIRKAREAAARAGLTGFGYAKGAGEGPDAAEAPEREAGEDWEDDPAPPVDVAALARLEASDTGNADRLLARFGDDLIFATHAGWHTWDGRRWRRDDRQHAVALAQRTARLIFRECGHLADKEAQERRAKWAVSSQNKGRIDGMLAMAVPHRAVAPEDLDADPWLLNVANGTLDLRTGELRPHRRGDRLTKLAPVAYDPKATAPTWTRFLGEILAGDEELVGFVRRAFGYSLIGDTSEQVIIVEHGGGSNGKSTKLEVLAALLGDYAQMTPTETFLAKDRAGGIPNDVARLRGARFVSAVETGSGRRLDEGLVKQVTGGDRMAARFLHREWFEFSPQFKLWLATNHKPEIRGTDHAVWRRIRLIPFGVKFWRANEPGRPEGAPVVDRRLRAKAARRAARRPRLGRPGLPGVAEGGPEGARQGARRHGRLPRGDGPPWRLPGRPV